MRYRVIDKKTKEDITNKYDWVITPNGNLSYLEYGNLIDYPDVTYLPEAAMNEFYKDVKTLKNLNYYNNNSEIVVENKKFENAELFAEYYCHNCGSQRCEGVGTPWFEGCKYKECLKDYEKFYGDD